MAGVIENCTESMIHDYLMLFRLFVLSGLHLISLHLFCHYYINSYMNSVFTSFLLFLQLLPYLLLLKLITFSSLLLHKYNLCSYVHVFRADHLCLDNASWLSSLEKTSSPSLSGHSFIIVALHLGAGPYEISKAF